MSKVQYPYDVLSGYGVHPGSSGRDVQDLAPPTARTANEAWRLLRDLRQRLKADFFLYQIQDPIRLADFRHQLDSLPQCPSVREMQDTLGEDAPVILLLMGQRRAAQDILETLQQQSPTDGHLAHQLALLCYATAQHDEETGAAEQAMEAWQVALANWVLTLSDDAYWEAWCNQRQTYYGGHPGDYLSPQLKADVRSDLQQHLQAQFTGYTDRYAREGNQARAQVYRELTARYMAEQQGAKALKAAGGLTLANGKKLVCGAWWLHKLGLEAHLGPLVAELQQELDKYQAMELHAALKPGAEPKVSSEVVEKLRRFFSPLAIAAAWLSLGQPELAVKELSPITLTEFAQQNSAYRRLDNLVAKFQRDQAKLIIQAQTAIAQQHLSAPVSNLGAAALAWREALAQGQAAGLGETVVQAISGLARARSQALMQESQREKLERLNEAMAVLEAAAKIIPEGQAREVVTEMVDLLSQRAHRRAKRLGDYEGAVDDLNRAFNLQPDHVDVRAELCVALINYAQERAEENKGEALTLLERARNLAKARLSELEKAGLQSHPKRLDLDQTMQRAQEEMDKLQGSAQLEQNDQAAYSELEEVLKKVRRDGNEPSDVASLIESAESKRHRRDYAGAVAEFEQVLKLSPDQAQAKYSLAQTYGLWAERLLITGGIKEAKEKVRVGKSYSADHPSLCRVQEQILIAERWLGEGTER